MGRRKRVCAGGHATRRQKKAGPPITAGAGPASPLQTHGRSSLKGGGTQKLFRAWPGSQVQMAGGHSQLQKIQRGSALSHPVPALPAPGQRYATGWVPCYPTSGPRTGMGDASCLAGSGCQFQASGGLAATKPLSGGQPRFICSFSSQQGPLHCASLRILNPSSLEAHSETTFSLKVSEVCQLQSQQNNLAASPLCVPFPYTVTFLSAHFWLIFAPSESKTWCSVSGRMHRRMRMFTLAECRAW